MTSAAETVQSPRSNVQSFADLTDLGHWTLHIGLVLYVNRIDYADDRCVYGRVLHALGQART